MAERTETVTIVIPRHNGGPDYPRKDYQRCLSEAWQELLDDSGREVSREPRWAWHELTQDEIGEFGDKVAGSLVAGDWRIQAEVSFIGSGPRN
jgi:hypothetical protein